MSLKERIMLEEQEGEKLLTKGYFYQLETQPISKVSISEADESETIEE